MQVRTKVVYEHDVYPTLPYQEQITDLLLHVPKIFNIYVQVCHHVQC